MPTLLSFHRHRSRTSSALILALATTVPSISLATTSNAAISSTAPVSRLPLLAFTNHLQQHGTKKQQFSSSFSLAFQHKEQKNQEFRPFTTNTNKMAPSAEISENVAFTAKEIDLDDPYMYLEEVESEESLSFARSANEACLKALGDPKTSGSTTYDRVLSVLESNDRIAHVRKMGKNENGEDSMYNFWKDGSNPKGLWRRVTMSSYKTSDPEWETVLDLDDLASKEDISWVWKGSRPLPRARDPMSEDGTRVTRALLSLSRGGADAIHLREFDLLTNEFVPSKDNGFVLPEAKTRASYKSRDVLLVGSDFGPGTLTDSGYPRTVREWVRGTDIKDAKVVFEGEATDVSVSAYIDDQRHHDGPIYEVRSRSLTFYTSKYWVRTIQYEHLLAPDDPLREGVEQPNKFEEVDVQIDADIDFVGKWMLISLRSDWEPTPGGKQYKKGSLIYVDAETMLNNGSEGAEYHILFEPTERSAYETYSVTKNYFILSIIENVKSKHLFFKFDKEDDGKLVFVGGDKEAQIRACYAGSVDPYESDDFWFTTSGYTQPSTLFLADAAKVENNDDGEGEEYIVEKLKSLPPQYDAAGLTVKQCVATSKDGTEVPYFLVTKEDTVLDGNTPTLLYGYGGFEISLGPKYIATSGIAWLERGGAYVEANIRGGGEFGPSWHQVCLSKIICSFLEAYESNFLRIVSGTLQITCMSQLALSVF
uniref:Prolyl endopeptidase n=1 Tax=Ditylum brightwellii TaxID=49249 RepID=A0A7S4QIB9_9STRA